MRFCAAFFASLGAALGLGVMPLPVAAQTESAEELSESDAYTMSDDGSASVIFPCNAEHISQDKKQPGLEASICTAGGLSFLFLVAEGEANADLDPFSSNFDAVKKDILTSPEAHNPREAKEDGRRVLQAELKAESDFGAIKAVELSSDKVAYAVVMSLPDDKRASSAKSRAVIAKFIDSLDIYGPE